jgi:methylisocitrate lyase
VPYVIADDLPDAPAGQRFRALLDRPQILQMPGAHTGIAALLAKSAGFEALYMSGAAMSATMGLPDLGMITVDEVAFYIRQVARAARLPMLVDGDTGYGEALNVMHMVRVFEEAGAGAGPPRRPAAAEEVRAPERQEARRRARHGGEGRGARKARSTCTCIARTDAVASEGMDARWTGRRCTSDAGADAIFPEALTTRRCSPSSRSACRA